jgi:glycosyltransferase involved in cell wall biosynthesis
MWVSFLASGGVSPLTFPGNQEAKTPIRQEERNDAADIAEWRSAMTSTTLSRNTNGAISLKEAAEPLTREARETLLLPGNGVWPRTENRLHGAAPMPPLLDGAGLRRDNRHALAVFCYAEPASTLGEYVNQTVMALAQRQTPVHLFSRHDFGLTLPGVSVYPVGSCRREDLIESVQEFASRACNAFLTQFPSGCPNVTVMGYEWSAVPALSVLCGIKNVKAILSVHSLERQRSDMSSEISKRIEQVELSGLREAKTIMVQQPATGEVAKYWVPECADRIVNARTRFPVDHFEGKIDPGAVKARYQVGPVDPTILFIGDLEERYGPDILIKAMPAILKNNKQVRLIIVGDGSLYWPVRVYTRYLLLEHAVRLVGSVEGQAAAELIQAADVIAVPSREQTPWWPILAGWAARRPVVATHHAAPGLLEHQQDSVLFYPSENSCVWGIERVLFDAAFGRTIARKGNEKLEERFGWNSLAAQLEELMGVTAKQ